MAERAGAGGLAAAASAVAGRRVRQSAGSGRRAGLAGLLLAGLLLLVLGPPPAAAVERESYEVVRVYPHDPRAWTQGLVYHDGHLYEGTGLYGASELRRVDLASGEVLQAIALPDELFGEGIALFGERIIQLTYKSGLGLVYARDSFALLGTFRYPGEGWGLTHDGRHLIMSDGSAYLRFLDPETFAEVRRVEVRLDGEPLARLNELEYIDGEVFANVWTTDQIVRIAPADGTVLGVIDLTGLLDPEVRRTTDAEVLNGIAYDAEGERLFVTGKLWPKLFEIRRVPPAQ